MATKLTLGKTLLLLGLCVIAVVAVTVALRNHQQDRTPEVPTGTDVGQLDEPYDFHPELTNTTPEVTAQNVLILLNTWNPATQYNSFDAYQKAVPILTGRMLHTARTPRDQQPKPMREWDGWARDKSKIWAVVKTGQVAHPSPDHAQVQVEVRQFVDSGPHTTPRQVFIGTVDVVKAPGGGGWLAEYFLLRPGMWPK